MKSGKFHYLLVFLLLGSLEGRAEGLDSTALDSAKRCLALQQYEDAATTLKHVLARNPRDINALYLLLATQQTRLLDYESYAVWGDSFLQFADSVVCVLDARLPKLRGADSIQCLYYVGNVYGGKSIIHAKNARWWQAVRDALTSISVLRQVRRLDSSLSEAYLGTGIFKYYLSNDLKWVPGVSNRAQEGLADIQRATKAPFPYDLAAKDLLCWALIDRGEYRQADSVAQTVTEEMPNNTIFLRIRALISLKMQRWTKALELSQQLITISRARAPVNWSDLLMGYRIQAEYYDYFQKGAEARELTRLVKLQPIPNE